MPTQNGLPKRDQGGIDYFAFSLLVLILVSFFFSAVEGGQCELHWRTPFPASRRRTQLFFLSGKQSKGNRKKNDELDLLHSRRDGPLPEATCRSLNCPMISTGKNKTGEQKETQRSDQQMASIDRSHAALTQHEINEFHSSFQAPVAVSKRRCHWISSEFHNGLNESSSIRFRRVSPDSPMAGLNFSMISSDQSRAGEQKETQSTGQQTGAIDRSQLSLKCDCFRCPNGDFCASHPAVTVSSDCVWVSVERRAVHFHRLMGRSSFFLAGAEGAGPSQTPVAEVGDAGNLKNRPGPIGLSLGKIGYAFSHTSTHLCALSPVASRWGSRLADSKNPPNPLQIPVKQQ